MSICLCYHDEQNFLHECGVCYGTKEKEPCSCGGDPAKCDFYEEVREKHIHRTNYDLIISKTPEELAEIMVSDCPPNYPHGECREYEKNDGNLDCFKCWLDWLKSPAEANNGL